MLMAAGSQQSTQHQAGNQKTHILFHGIISF
jgi:hypothetical protein